MYFFESKLPESKSVYFSLIYTYGIGKSKAFLICKRLGFGLNFKTKDLSTVQASLMLKLVENSNYILASDLKRLKLLTKQKLVSIKSYRGLRQKKRLPVRGQRTHTNAKTAKKSIY